MFIDLIDNSDGAEASGPRPGRAERGAPLEGWDWVTLERAATDTGVSRAALRGWYRTGQIPSRLVDGPHGPQLVIVVVPSALGVASHSSPLLLSPD